MEDTERRILQRPPRIPVRVTVGSIRWRILKALDGLGLPLPNLGYSGLDPMEDTERRNILIRPHVQHVVTVGSIRWRILKVCT